MKTLFWKTVALLAAHAWLASMRVRSRPGRWVTANRAENWLMGVAAAAARRVDDHWCPIAGRYPDPPRA